MPLKLEKSPYLFKIKYLINIFYNKKLPPYAMNPGIILWKTLFLKPNDFSPVVKALKFSAVFGVMSLKSSNTTLPISPFKLISKKT